LVLVTIALQAAVDTFAGVMEATLATAVGGYIVLLIVRVLKGATRG